MAKNTKTEDGFKVGDLINVGTEDKPVMVDPRGHPKGIPHEVTGVNSHIATQPGYAHRRVINVGEFVPHGIAVADEWMAENPDYVEGTTAVEETAA